MFSCVVGDLLQTSTLLFLISIDFCDEAKVEYPFLQKPVISYKQDSTALHMDVD